MASDVVGTLPRQGWSGGADICLLPATAPEGTSDG